MSNLEKHTGETRDPLKGGNTTMSWMDPGRKENQTQGGNAIQHKIPGVANYWNYAEVPSDNTTGGSHVIVPPENDKSANFKTDDLKILHENA